MERCSSIFSQILQIFSKREFFEAVYDTKAAKGIKEFGVWDHFVAMLFCQMGNANSLREICGGLASAFGKVRHLGIRKARSDRVLLIPINIYSDFQSRCAPLATGHMRVTHFPLVVSVHPETPVLS